MAHPLIEIADARTIAADFQEMADRGEVVGAAVLVIRRDGVFASKWTGGEVVRLLGGLDLMKTDMIQGLNRS